MATCKEWMQKGCLEEFWKKKKKKRKTSKFVDVGSYNRMRERGINNME